MIRFGLRKKRKRDTNDKRLSKTFSSHSQAAFRCFGKTDSA